MANKKNENSAAATAPAVDPTPQAEPAAPKKAKAKFVELKDKDTGFFDSATGFQVVRDQKVELDETVGEATQVALESGRLLFVEK